MIAQCIRCGHEGEADFRFGAVTSDRKRKIGQQRCNYPDVVICTTCMEELHEER